MSEIVTLWPFSTDTNIVENISKTSLMDKDASGIVIIDATAVEGIPMKAAYHVNGGGEPSPRPLTYELVQASIESLGAKILSYEITEVQGKVWYGALIIEDSNGEQHEIDARVSDIVAMAAHNKRPVLTHKLIFEDIKQDPLKFVPPEFLSRWREKHGGTQPKEQVITRDKVKRREVFGDMLNELDFSGFKNFIGGEEQTNGESEEPRQTDGQAEDDEDGETPGATIRL